MNIWELKIQRLKKDIEETREKLNVLMDQSELNITEEILKTSQELDILIVNYYVTWQKGIVRISETK